MVSLGGLFGQRIIGVRRVLYVGPDGTIDPTDGDVELTTEHGGVMRFGVHLGEQLAISDSLWTDPFEGELSPENKAFVSTVGKRSAFDVTPEAAAAGLLGNVRDVTVSAARRYLTDVLVMTSDGVLCVEVGADILIVHYGPRLESKQQAGLQLLYPNSVANRIVEPEWYANYVPGRQLFK